MKLSQTPPARNASQVVLQIRLGVGLSVPSAGLQYGNTVWQAIASARILHLVSRSRFEVVLDFAEYVSRMSMMRDAA